MKGYFEYTEEPVVSSDFVGSTVGGVFDATAGLSINDRFTKLFACTTTSGAIRAWRSSSSSTYAKRIISRA
jgi:glyceraldehyde 3-phosphate dehydrogenase